MYQAFFFSLGLFVGIALGLMYSYRNFLFEEEED